MQTSEVVVRSDHLEAVIKFCINEVDASSGSINPLDFSSNENAIGEYCLDAESRRQEITAALQLLLDAVQSAKGASHKNLLLLPLPANFNPVTAIKY